jgi:hypothetical protein
MNYEKKVKGQFYFFWWWCNDRGKILVASMLYPKGLVIVIIVAH